MGDLLPYARHEVSEAEVRRLMGEARRIAKLQSVQVFVFLTRALVENASLTAECQAHRAARGLEPLPQYEAKVKL